MGRSTRVQRPLEAIVLHLAPYAEAHRLVELFSAAEGRITLLARGARASRRRFAGVLDLFAQLKVQAQGGLDGELGTLAAADLLNARLGLRSDLARLRRASALCGCVRLLWPPGQPAPHAFVLLRLALDYAACGQVARAAGAYPRLAQAAGIMPSLERCGHCGKDCPLGISLGPQALPLCQPCSGGKALLAARVWEALSGAKITDASTADAVEEIMMAWTAAHCGRTIHLLPHSADAKP